MKQFVISLFFLSLLSFKSLQGQNNVEMFYVLHVAGNISIEKTNAPIKSGDILQGNISFKFSTDNDFAILASTQRGRMVLFKNKEEKYMGELKYYLMNNVLPENEYTGTRGKEENQYAYLVFDKKDQLLFPKHIQVSSLPADENSYYFIRMKVNEDNLIIKPELNGDKKIVILPEAFYINDKPIDVNTITDISLYFHKAESNKDLLVKGTNLSILIFEDVKKEVDILQSVMENQGKNQGEITQGSIDYLKEVYGKMDDSLINMLLK